MYEQKLKLLYYLPMNKTLTIEKIVNFTIFIDESGTLPDIKDRVIVIAAVGTNTPIVIDDIFKTLQKKEKLRKKTGELKFYTAGDKTKQFFLKS